MDTFFKISFYTTLLVLGVIFIGCENPTEYQFHPQLTLNAELKAGFPIDSVFLSWSSAITERYDTEDKKVSGANITMNGIQLLEYSADRGVYYYPDQNYLVQEGMTYTIEVKAGTESVSSVTTVPHRFRFTSLGVTDGDTIRYVPGTSFFSDEFFTIVWPDYQDSRIYRIISVADSAIEANFIEDDRPEAEIFKGEKGDRKNPGMWWVADQYVRINWMYFNWTGWHSIIISAMDENYYYYRQGILFGEQDGQNFNEVVKSGLGLFCSSASDTLRIYVTQ